MGLSWRARDGFTRFNGCNGRSLYAGEGWMDRLGNIEEFDEAMKNARRGGCGQVDAVYVCVCWFSAQRGWEE